MFKGNSSEERGSYDGKIKPSIGKVTEYNAFDAFDPLVHGQFSPKKKKPIHKPKTEKSSFERRSQPIEKASFVEATRRSP